MLHLRKNEYKGKLLVFEGTDGAGKTTLISMTRQYLIAQYGEDNVLLEKQPTDLSRKTRLFQKMMYSEHKENIDYRAVQLLTLSDRVQHNHEVIVPALRAGKIVICDRYIYTSVANMLARGYTHEKWFFEASRGIVKPDIAFLAYVTPEKAIERIRTRPTEKDRYLDETLLKNVAGNFMRYHKRWNLQLVDTDRTAEQSFEEIKKRLHVIKGEEDEQKRPQICNGYIAEENA